MHSGSIEILQGAQAEHDEQVDLFSPSHLELGQGGNRQRQDEDVEYDTDNGVSPGEDIEAETFPLRLSGPSRPSVLDWPAVEDAG